MRLKKALSVGLRQHHRIGVRQRFFGDVLLRLGQAPGAAVEVI
ncbi:hypothetical protein GGQ85_004257 [Nitrobacter vulgaris]|nr:hypothetical protein [Nitrobacter vulgaris]